MIKQKRKKLTFDDCINVALEHKCRCLSMHYKSPREKLLWECEKGHQWKAPFSDILYKKTWCVECAGKKKLDGIKMAQEIAKLKKGKCLSIEYKNSTNQKLLWECEKGHQWYASLNQIKDKKTWCKKCAGLEKLTIEIAKEEAKKRNGECLSEEYFGVKQKLIWKCKCGHQWEATLNNIKNRHSWCPECFQKNITINDAKKIASEQRGRCLSDVYVPNKKLLWQCEFGHQWEAILGNIKNNKAWCPECGLLNSAKKMNNAQISQHWKTGESLICVGSYEIKTVHYLNCNKIEYLWQTKKFFLPDNRTYRPDVYLFKENKWIEIKGYFWGDAKEKWDWFHSQYSNSELWDKQKLQAIGIL
jgi:hypothetical protein